MTGAAGRGAERSAIVVGGGLSGLATAIALHGRGWRVRVLERAPRLAEAGAGISLWPNALRALDAIGVGERVRAMGGPELHGGIRRRDGRFLARTDAAEIARRYGSVVILHRADLLQALVEAVPAGSVDTGHAVDNVDNLDNVDGATATVDGEPADLVVGADGIRSAVRRSVWPQAAGPRYVGYTAWRWVTRPLAEPLHDAGETWGAGTRFGYAGLPDGRVYCYATANVPAGEKDEDGYGHLKAMFGDWHDPIPALVAAADKGEVLRHDMEELPDLPSYVHGRVALVGDAAHAMTPNLGQGACQAFEDVATLAAVLDEERDVATALSRYDRLRRRHTQSVVRQSRRVGQIGQWSSPIAVGLRDRLLALVPASATTRSLTQLLEWSPR